MSPLDAPYYVRSRKRKKRDRNFTFLYSLKQGGKHISHRSEPFWFVSANNCHSRKAAARRQSSVHLSIFAYKLRIRLKTFICHTADFCLCNLIFTQTWRDNVRSWLL